MGPVTTCSDLHGRFIVSAPVLGNRPELSPAKRRGCTQHAMFKRLAVLIGVQRALCIPTNELREMAKPCAPGQECEMDGYVGSKVIFEDDLVRVWNFTLPPGGMTSLHRHDLDYHFIAIIPTQLEVYDWQGTRLFDFRAEGTKGFRVKGDLLEPTVGTLPTPLPRLHSALNIGLNDYYEVLVEHKHRPSEKSEL